MKVYLQYRIRLRNTDLDSIYRKIISPLPARSQSSSEKDLCGRENKTLTINIVFVFRFQSHTFINL